MKVDIQNRRVEGVEAQPRMIDTNSAVFGFVVGQIVLLFTLFYFVKVFLFSAPARQRKPTLPLREFPAKSKKTAQTQSRQNNNPHDWLNVLMANLIQNYRNDSGFCNRILKMIQTSFHDLPSFIDRVDVCQFSLGEKFPVIKSCRYCGDHAEIVLEFHDHISITLETQLLINWPNPGIPSIFASLKSGTAGLPVTLEVSVNHFSATVGILSFLLTHHCSCL